MNALKTILIALLILLAVLVMFARGFDIPPDAREKNPGSYCTWASIQAVGRTHDIWQLEHILREQVREYPNGFPGYEELVTGRMTSLGVNFSYSPQGKHDHTILEKYADSDGVVVSLKRGNPHSKGCHSIVLTSYNDSTVCFYDSNKPDRNYKCGRAWFDQWWLGDSLVILTDKMSDK